MASLPPHESIRQRRKRDFEESFMVTPSPTPRRSDNSSPSKRSKHSADVAPIVDCLMTRLESPGKEGMESSTQKLDSAAPEKNKSSSMQQATADAPSASSKLTIANTLQTLQQLSVNVTTTNEPNNTVEKISRSSDDTDDDSFVSVAQEEIPLPQSSTTKSSDTKRKRKLPPAFRHCAGCTAAEEPATVWCCECARCLCTPCDNRMHDNDALDALRRPMCSHRVEIIIDGGGIPVLSPLLEMVVLAGAVVAFRPLLTGAGTMLNVEYFFESVCPIVQKVRRLVFRVDHALYPLVRSTLGAWCDTEDAFVKIFVDVWVRGVLTSTDSFALLLMKAPATIGAIFVVLALAPLLSIPYAAMATVVRLVELFLFRNWMITRIVAKLIRWLSFIVWLPCRIAGWVCRSTVLGLVMDNDYRQHFHRRMKIPPKTGHRIRPTPSDGIEDITFGAITRITRIFWYFHRKARRAIIGAIVTAVFLAVLVRVLLLSTPRCGKGILSSTAQQEMWTMLLATSDEEQTDEAPPQCMSVHAIVRKLAARIGVEMPDFDSLGDEGFVLARLQDATDDDYIDLTLRHFCCGLAKSFMRFPLLIRVMVLGILFSLLFAGVLRRLAFWSDLKRRYRYRHIRDAILKSSTIQDQPTTKPTETSKDDIDETQNRVERDMHELAPSSTVALPPNSIPRLMKAKMKMKRLKKKKTQQPSGRTDKEKTS